MEEHGDAELRCALLGAASQCEEEEQGEEPAERQRMGVLDRLALSPWEKWRRHGRFPAKPALHAALLALTAAQLALYSAQNAAYMRASHRNWSVRRAPLCVT
jgi:hypothetical protein